MKIVPASIEQAESIASLIMLAMNHECCQNFAGPSHTLEDFHRMMIALVRRDDSQYSYRNAMVALDDNTTDGHPVVAGVIVGYDGADLHRLRETFLQAAKEFLGQDFRGMDDETQAGEYYIDSLAVNESYRHQGLATLLLKKLIDQKGQRQPVGLLVDKGNPGAERLYRSLGFEYVNDATWGGHEMRHLQTAEK
ncbi:GNAT family N-acetyltransferase [Hallella absiana]|jgi:ribosomal protein S18 acetylase RimI-like enzyme|uniref:GNAT family N-acetyltransferase n=1 Tax=Hallella absiana TaxID=2925336 RepID=UPI0021C99E7F|nr:GNAT family N-acetyltransferase [Hallella absiana]